MAQCVLDPRLEEPLRNFWIKSKSHLLKRSDRIMSRHRRGQGKVKRILQSFKCSRKYACIILQRSKNQK